jgi:hypothetical protein
MSNTKLTTINVAKVEKAVLGPWTVVEVRSDSGARGYGASHKSKLDRWNEELGYNIALGRAKKDLFNKVNKVKSKNRTVFVG